MSSNVRIRDEEEEEELKKQHCAEAGSLVFDQRGSLAGQSEWSTTSSSSDCNTCNQPDCM
jgi:hypothetical protein